MIMKLLIGNKDNDNNNYIKSVIQSIRMFAMMFVIITPLPFCLLLRKY